MPPCPGNQDKVQPVVSRHSSALTPKATSLGDAVHPLIQRSLLVRCSANALADLATSAGKYEITLVEVAQGTLAQHFDTHCVRLVKAI